MTRVAILPDGVKVCFPFDKEIGMTQGFARCLCLLLGCLLAACTTRTDAQEKDMGLDPATAAYQKYGYNDRPVEARLGPHRYLIPANYFRDQIGPDFQGNFSLLVQWPDLQPLPPGERSKQDMETFAKQITISPDYIDRVPMEGLLEKSIHHYGPEGTPEHHHPSERLELRDEEPKEFGLSPYRVNSDKFAAYLKEWEQEYGYQSHARLEDQKDWYLDRGTDGRLTTVIKCDSRLQPDGISIEGDRLTREEGRSSGCTHYFLMPDEKISFSAFYVRAFLKDWKRIEIRSRELLKQYRVR
ncbi:hypothetical protein ACFONC_09195 [Luteimonas soli]|uniref:DUF3304 domain-containing protein n=1 Tax=Luteimonas soli TaxID=1648966 RepID=A0ABV7XKM2_9GAMM